MEVGVYINYWRDLSLLKHAMMALIYQPCIKEIVVHDGRYKEFPDEGYMSKDGVKEYCKKIEKVTHWEGNIIYKTQMEKREWMFTFIPTGNWILAVDADEVMMNVGILQNLHIRDKVGLVTEFYTMPDDNRMHQRKHWRLVYNDGCFSFGQNHFQLLRNGKPYETTWDTGLMFIHMRDKRDKERMDKKMEYYKRRKEKDVDLIWT